MREWRRGRETPFPPQELRFYAAFRDPNGVLVYAVGVPGSSQFPYEHAGSFRNPCPDRPCSDEASRRGMGLPEFDFENVRLTLVRSGPSRARQQAQIFDLRDLNLAAHHERKHLARLQADARYVFSLASPLWTHVGASGLGLSCRLRAMTCLVTVLDGVEPWHLPPPVRKEHWGVAGWTT
jgi:hypothetical protein